MILQNPSFQLTTCRRKQSAVAALLRLAPGALAGNLKFSVFAKYYNVYTLRVHKYTSHRQQIRRRRAAWRRCRRRGVEAGGKLF